MIPLRGANILRLAGSLRTCADVIGVAFAITEMSSGLDWRLAPFAARVSLPDPAKPTFNHG